MEGDHVGVLAPWDAPSSDYVLTISKATEILKEVEARWKAGRPFSDDHRSSSRYLVTYLTTSHDMTKPQAKKVLADWLKSGMLTREVYDSRAKKSGLYVMKFPGKID